MSTAAFYLERMNAANDARNCDQAEAPVLYLDDGSEKKLPMRWVVCPVCDGRGSHVNPSIDADGLSAEDFDQDPDFAESYLAGEYDQTCNKCSGRTTVPAVDESRLSAAELKAWRKQQRDDADLRAMERAEYMRGA